MVVLPAVADHPLWWISIAIVGLVVGLISGMFGIGGNFLLIPVLSTYFGVPIQVAVGTSLCQIIGTGVSALHRHQRRRNGEIRIDILMVAGGLIGSLAGAYCFSRLAEAGTISIAAGHISTVKFAISIIYMCLLSLVAGWMFYDSRKGAKPPTVSDAPLIRIGLAPFVRLPKLKATISAMTGAYLGLAMGFLSGLVGMGGGVILMPVLIYGMGMGVRMAAGTGILALICCAAMGTISHAIQGHVHLGLAMTLLLGSTIGAPLGANVTLKIDPATTRKIFAMLALLTAGSVAWDLARILLLKSG